MQYSPPVEFFSHELPCRHTRDEPQGWPVGGVKDEEEEGGESGVEASAVRCARQRKRKARRRGRVGP